MVKMVDQYLEHIYTNYLVLQTKLLPSSNTTSCDGWWPCCCITSDLKFILWSLLSLIDIRIEEKKKKREWIKLFVCSVFQYISVIANVCYRKSERMLLVHIS